MFKTFIFDLDGTLLNTLTDLTSSVNYALQLNTLPIKSEQEVRSYLGNGIRNLIHQCVPADTPKVTFETVFSSFKSHYAKHSLDKTQPYQGILSLLRSLRARGMRIGMVSNKIDSVVQQLHNRFFVDTIEIAVGESAGVPRKPNPSGILQVMEALGATHETTIYVGDSEVDFATAQAAEIACALVLWGYRDKKQLYPLQAEHYCAYPQDLLRLC